MKRHGRLWPGLIDFPNLLRAAHQAQRRKGLRPDVARFHLDLEHNLWALHQELASRTCRPGPYHTFTIRHPRPRQVSAASYCDRASGQDPLTCKERSAGLRACQAARLLPASTLTPTRETASRVATLLHRLTHPRH
jgi:hypothetical protein